MSEGGIHLTLTDKILKIVLLPFIPVWVLPNHITYFRLLMIPIIILFLTVKVYSVGVVLFILAAFSDAVDGALARTRNQITDVGKILDPLVDKVLIVSIVIMLVPQYFGWLLTGTILLFEILLVGNAFLMQKWQATVIQANGAGKIKMIFQSCGVAMLLIFVAFPIPFFLFLAQILLYIGVASALISLFVYRSI
ncbi:MAG TPA: CDP-alcohol phosphatidyltransferase family protein [Candidatus Paceibacterota bacterium]